MTPDPNPCAVLGCALQAEEGLPFAAALEKVRDRYAAIWRAYLFR